MRCIVGLGWCVFGGGLEGCDKEHWNIITINPVVTNDLHYESLFVKSFVWIESIENQPFTVTIVSEGVVLGHHIQLHISANLTSLHHMATCH
jgi:hypothetical protein